MPVANKTKLILACATGGTCTISAPIAFHFSQRKAGDTAEIKEELRELTRVGVNLVVNNKTIREDRTNSYSSGGERMKNLETTREHSFKNTKNEKFEELWNKIAAGYDNAQKVNKEEVNNTLSWKNELESILLKERNLNNSEWVIEEEEYKDCSRITGGKSDYCGFLKLRNGDSEYRLKFDRYGLSHSRKWDVYILRQDENVTKYYSKDGTWKNSPTSKITSFKGEQNARNNWWIKLERPSIEI